MPQATIDRLVINSPYEGPQPHWRGRVDLEVFCYTPDDIAERGRDIGLVARALKEGRRI